MIHSKKKNTGDTISMDEKSETYEERFQRLKSEDKLIPLGNGRWIEVDAYVETMTQARERFKDVKFFGEQEHPNAAVGEELVTKLETMGYKHYPYQTPMSSVPPISEESHQHNIEIARSMMEMNKINSNGRIISPMIQL